MPILVNGQPVPEEVIRQESERIARDVRWKEIRDEKERARRQRAAAEHSAVNRILVEQAAAADPRPIDAADLENGVHSLKGKWGCRSAFDDTQLRESVERTHIIEAVLRYRFCSAAQIVRLAGGNEDVTHRRLRRLWERGLITRWAFPGFRTHSEFYYYLDSREPLDLLAERRQLEIHPQMLEEMRSHREKDYAGAAVRGQHMQLGFLNHGLMISRMHFMVEMACRKSGGDVALEAWCQGGQIAGHKVDVPKVKSSRQGGQLFWQEVAETERLPVEPDALFTLRFAGRPEGQQLAHFFYEADRGTMVITDMLKKFRGCHHFIKKQQRHKEAFGIHPVRAVLIETTDEPRGQRLMELVNHPLVSGPAKRTGLFWFTISPLFADPVDGTSLPRYLNQPELVFNPIWAFRSAAYPCGARFERHGERARCFCRQHGSGAQKLCATPSTRRRYFRACSTQMP